MNAYNAVKAGLYGVAFDEPGVPEGAELVVEETSKRYRNRAVRWLTLEGRYYRKECFSLRSYFLEEHFTFLIFL